MRLFSLVFAFIAVLIPWHLSADEILMKNGDRLTGTVKKMRDGKLLISTSYAKEISIDWSEVESIKSDELLTIMNPTNEVVAEVESIAPGSEYHPDASSDYVINPDLWRIGRAPLFTGRIDFAYQVSRGNTDTDQLDTSIFTEYRLRKNRYTLEASLENEESEGERTTDRYSIEGEYDRFFNKRTFGSLVSSFQSDDFADLDSRFVYGAALGHQFYETDRTTLSFEAGPSRVHEDFASGLSRSYWAARWKMRFDYFIVPKALQFYHSQTGLWSLDDTDTVLGEATLGFRSPIYAGITGTAEAKLLYNNTPDEGADRLDRTIGLKLGYHW